MGERKTFHGDRARPSCRKHAELVRAWDGIEGQGLGVPDFQKWKKGRKIKENEKENGKFA
jgi:hypothetical protein